MDGVLSPALRERNGPPAPSPADIALLGRQPNRLYRWTGIGTAQRELSRGNGERFLILGYGYVPRADCLRHCSTPVLLKEAHFWYKGGEGGWWLEKIGARTTTDGL